MVVAGAGADAQIEPGHGFEVVVEHIGAGIDHLVGGVALAHEIRRQDLDRGGGRLGADGPHHRGEVGRASVVQVVAVDRGDDHVLEAHLANRPRHPLRLSGIERLRQAGGDIAEGAGAGADLAHDHHGGMGLAPALPDVRAGRLLADCGQTVGLHDVQGGVVAGGPRRAHAQPGRLAQGRRLGPSLLFRMPLSAGRASVDNRRHGV